MTLWLIEPTAGARLDEALSLGIRPTATQEAAIEARLSALSTGAPSPFRTSAGPTSRISIEGVLTKKPSFLAMLFGLSGGASYEEIQAALRQADLDPETVAIELFIDSPGGQVSGLFETIAAIQATTKPITVVAAQAASAAYALAAVAGPIEATTPAAVFGSIGVMATFRPSGTELTLKSTDAPAKNPDPFTAEGKAEIQAYLDNMHGLFVEAIGMGRGVDPKLVSAKFGRGATLLATQAKEQGLIDSIRRPRLRAVGGKPTQATAESTVEASNQEIPAMDLKTLRAQHPDLVEALVQEGITQERERVQAHLVMGEQCGDLKIALEAINKGTGFGHAPTQALYMAKAMNNRDINAHVEDSAKAEEALKGAETTAATKDLGDQLADLMLGQAKAQTKEAV
jgi:ClpP class serine protease